MADDIVVRLILGGMVLGSFWFGAPGFLYFLGYRKVSHGWYPDGHPLATKPGAAALISTLREAGFVELGTRWEKDWPLDFPTRDVSLVAPDGTWGLVFTWLKGFRVMFLSRFQDGSFVVTSQDSENRPVDVGGLSLAGAPRGSTAQQTLAHHRERVAKVSAGKVPLVDLSRDARLEMCRAYYELEGVRVLRRRRALSYSLIFGNGLILLWVALRS